MLYAGQSNGDEGPRLLVDAPNGVVNRQGGLLSQATGLYCSDLLSGLRLLLARSLDSGGDEFDADFLLALLMHIHTTLTEAQIGGFRLTGDSPRPRGISNMTWARAV